MDGRDFGESEIDEISDGLLIKITPLKTKRVLSSPYRYTNAHPNCVYSFHSSRQMPHVTLSAVEEEEVNYYGYRSNLPIHMSGDTEKRATNILLVNGVKVFVGDVPLALFLRLVVELFKDKRGTVSRTKLINAGLIKPDGEFQSVSRLRQAFRAALGSVNPEEIIETCERKSIRLSTHPSLISYDKDKLLRHRNEKIRRLARRLP